MLADGTVFKGLSIGKKGTAGGEICFNTGMTGYQEIYTDPSYYGQIVVNTNAHIGNYGVFSEETESSAVKIQGLVVKSFSEVFSRKTAENSLQEYLERSGVVGISNVDTRKLVRYIRDKGAMNAVISSEITDLDLLRAELAKVPDMSGLELASAVSTKETYFVGNPEATYKVAVLDVGIKKSILRFLVENGCYCKVFPAKTTFEEMNAWSPDGYFISNGPGDPSAMGYAVETIQKITAADYPLFGICLGHQVICLANGIGTYKMHNGHRGLNHPIKNLATGLCEVTSQNHGFVARAEDVAKSDKVEATHVHLNDGTVAGIKVKGKKIFSVQYHPESSPGPHDSRYLFKQFIDMITAKQSQTV